MSFKFEKLMVWQKALDLANEIENLTKIFPKDVVYILNAQIKRAANSIALNIAVGSTGQSNAEFIGFLRYTLRPDIEVVGCLCLAKKRKYLLEERY